MLATRVSWHVGAVFVVWVSATPEPGVAQERDDDLGWANATELSIVVTEGNTSTQTLGFKNTLRRTWESARLRLRFDGVRSNTSDDRFLQVQPGLQFPVGGQPPEFQTSIAIPAIESDVEQYFVEGRFDRDISERLFWDVGSSWDRNNDAGILNRHILFGGVGNVWFNEEDVAFSTSYGVSYTDRQEIEPNPSKDNVFGGVRFNSDYMQRFGSLTLVDSNFTLNMNLADATDYSINVTNAVGVAMNDYLSLRVSLQFLYENEPALEDADIVARVELIDPDGVPASGDELFETMLDGRTRIDVGQGRIRKNPLDTVLRTALVISF